MRIGLVYDLFDAYPWKPGDPPDADAEYEPEATVEALEAGVRVLGHTPVRIGSARDLLARIHTLDIDAAVNIAEGAHSRNREAYAPMLLEMAGIPFLGSDALTLSLSLDKAWTKDLAAAAGVPTPSYRVYASMDEIDEADLLDFPLFVKPRYEGTAKGITAKSKVRALDALREQVAWVAQTYRQDALVERFIEGGGEFTVAVLGNDPPEPLPALQRAVEVTTRIGLHALDRRGLPDQPWDYALDGRLDPALEAALQTHAVTIFEKLQCRDFARVDFRVDADGRPWFLEINPLPTFAPDGTFAIMAELVGRPYDAFLADVLARGLKRLGL
ncbi:MAG: D-alanine--D-alanine ligase [Rhodothermales bacterium]